MLAAIVVGRRGQGSRVTADLWQTAEATIGPSEGDDYVLQPTTHAHRYEERTPDLARLLRRTATRIAAEEFERADGIAVESQRTFKRAAAQANAAALMTAWASAGVLLAALFDAPGLVLVALGALGALAGAFGAFLTQRLRQQHLLQRWMAARANSETHRHTYFEQVVLTDPSADPPSEPTAADDANGAKGAPELSLLQLEYFRRYQLDVQLRYCDQRQRQHRRSADRTVSYAAAAGFFAALSTGLAGVLGAEGDVDWAGLAAFGIVGTSLASYAAAREAIGQDSRNAERLEQTRIALRDLYARLDDVRHAVALGNRWALEEFVAAVHEHLSLEHRQWLREAEMAHSGLARVEAALRGPAAPEAATAAERSSASDGRQA